MSSARFGSSRKNLAIEGLRTLAVLGVILHHTLTDVLFDQYLGIFGPGPGGVRLFFVLSGYLITGILLNARTTADARGASRAGVLRAFYGRRALRIFPLAYAAMFVVWAIGLPAMREHAWWYLLFASNIRVALINGWDIGLSHFWSLAVEEQFYLLWPAVLLWTPRPRQPQLIVAVILLVALVRGVVAQHSILAAAVLTVTRFDALAMGALLAWNELAGRKPLALPLLVLGTFCLALAAALPATAAIANESGLVCLYAVVIEAAGRRRLWGWLETALTWRPMVAAGAISYGLYVWHPLVSLLVKGVERTLHLGMHFPDPGWARFLLVSGATWVMAATSWRLLEQPINALKRFMPYVHTSASGSARVA